MALAPTLQKHLDQNVTYEVITHDPTMSSTRTAQACHVSGDRLAKAIVLRRDGRYMLAVLPASHHIRLPDLRQQVGDDVSLADETEIKRLERPLWRGIKSSQFRLAGREKRRKKILTPGAVGIKFHCEFN